MELKDIKAVYFVGAGGIGMSAIARYFLSCGMVFEDAFARIAALRGEGSGKDAFGRMLAESREEAAKTGGDPLVLIARKGAAAKIKELSRLTALIMENRYSGADLRQKLRTEGEAMWNERLKQAQEQGKLAETRLSFPLSVMLVVLSFCIAFRSTSSLSRWAITLTVAGQSPKGYRDRSS